MRKLSTFVAFGLAAAAVLFSGLGQVEARPPFPKTFVEAYPNLADKAKEAKCGVCHPVNDKKVRNDYGMALGKALGAPNVKDAAKLKAALNAIESLPSGTDGKTFGDLIKAGELPGKNS